MLSDTENTSCAQISCIMWNLGLCCLEEYEQINPIEIILAIN